MQEPARAGLYALVGNTREADRTARKPFVMIS